MGYRMQEAARVVSELGICHIDQHALRRMILRLGDTGITDFDVMDSERCFSALKRTNALEGMTEIQRRYPDLVFQVRTNSRGLALYVGKMTGGTRMRLLARRPWVINLFSEVKMKLRIKYMPHVGYFVQVKTGLFRWQNVKLVGYEYKLYPHTCTRNPLGTRADALEFCKAYIDHKATAEGGIIYETFIQRDESRMP